jgi:hypothetical protein
MFANSSIEVHMNIEMTYDWLSVTFKPDGDALLSDAFPLGKRIEAGGWKPQFGYTSLAV